MRVALTAMYIITIYRNLNSVMLISVSTKYPVRAHSKDGANEASGTIEKPEARAASP